MTDMRRVLPLAAVAALALALGGCGFTPLYAVPGVSAGLSSIEVKAPHGRTAFLIGEQLDDAFARDRDTPPVYQLDFTVSEHRYPRGLRIDNVANVYETHVTITYQLVELATGRVVTVGTVPVSVNYDVADQPYAGLAAQESSEERAAEDAAQRMRIKLATFLKDPAPKKKQLKRDTAATSSESERLQASEAPAPSSDAAGAPPQTKDETPPHRDSGQTP
jgi:LPS-assembly lipoprotein